jgi:DnaK suppressor protein
VLDHVTDLQHQLRKLEAQIEHLEAALQEKPDYGLGKGDPAITGWEMNQAVLQELKERSTSLREAIERASQGTYGICERCAKPIHPDRLSVLPDVRLCIECARTDRSR